MFSNAQNMIFLHFQTLKIGNFTNFKRSNSELLTASGLSHRRRRLLINYGTTNL